MNIQRRHVKQWGSIFFILLLLVFKCADLHQFTHNSKKAKETCTICQLAHAQSQTDTYVAPQQIAFNSTVFTVPSVSVDVAYQNSFVSEPLFGIFLNKAPPVA